MGTCKFLISILSTFLIVGCDFEDTYVDACIGRYSIEKLKDSLANKYKIDTSSIDSKQWQKIQFANKHNCDTITLEIPSDNETYFSSDTFALAMAKTFYNDSLNRNIRFLKLDLVGYWSVKHNPNEFWRDDGYVFINYGFDRNVLNTSNLPNEQVDTDSMEYEVESETPFTFIVSNKSNEELHNKGLRLNVKMKKDYKRSKLLAAQIRNRYDSVINNRQLSNFSLEMTVDSLSCKSCNKKSYRFSYDIMQYLKR